MYKIIGADRKEYGPITADQIRQWIAERRVNGQTMVQAEGSTDWKPLASFPEFASLLPPQPAVPPSPGPPPGLSQVPPPAAASSQVQGPAIGLMVVAALNFALGIIKVISSLVGSGAGNFGPMGNPDVERLLQMTSGVGGVILGLMTLGIGA